MTDRVDAVFAALADPTRRGILRSVASGGPVTSTELAAELPISRQAVAKHLSVLSRAGLVDATRAGRETRWRATPGGLEDARRWMERVGADWDRRLAALRERLGP